MFRRPKPDVFNPSTKAVILSEAATQIYCATERCSAKPKDLGDTCLQMLFGAFRPQTFGGPQAYPTLGMTKGGKWVNGKMRQLLASQLFNELSVLGVAGDELRSLGHLEIREVKTRCYRATDEGKAGRVLQP